MRSEKNAKSGRKENSGRVTRLRALTAVRRL